MSQLSDFINEHNVGAEAIVAESKVTEQLSSADRANLVKRETARRTKKTYADLGADKPSGLRRGVSSRILKLAIDGQPITRINRKKIARAISNLLKGEVEVSVPKLFGDVRSQNHKNSKDSDD